MLALLSLSISHSLQPSVESADAPLPGALYLDATFAAKSSSSLCAKGTSGKGCKTVALSPDGHLLYVADAFNDQVRQVIVRMPATLVASEHAPCPRCRVRR